MVGVAHNRDDGDDEDDTDELLNNYDSCDVKSSIVYTISKHGVIWEEKLFPKNYVAQCHVFHEFIDNECRVFLQHGDGGDATYMQYYRVTDKFAVETLQQTDLCDVLKCRSNKCKHCVRPLLAGSKFFLNYFECATEANCADTTKNGFVFLVGEKNTN